ncbi:hypothetical protein HK405_007579 [Cladochytrium tenue]|nr:hypothetical protein HK405_007579 [Cladochytrium tenue]
MAATAASSASASSSSTAHPKRSRPRVNYKYPPLDFDEDDSDYDAAPPPVAKAGGGGGGGVNKTKPAKTSPTPPNVPATAPDMDAGAGIATDLSDEEDKEGEVTRCVCKRKGSERKSERKDGSGHDAKNGNNAPPTSKRRKSDAAPLSPPISRSVKAEPDRADEESDEDMEEPFDSKKARVFEQAAETEDGDGEKVTPDVPEPLPVGSVSGELADSLNGALADEVPKNELPEAEDCADEEEPASKPTESKPKPDSERRSKRSKSRRSETRSSRKSSHSTSRAKATAAAASAKVRSPSPTHSTSSSSRGGGVGAASERPGGRRPPPMRVRHPSAKMTLHEMRKRAKRIQEHAVRLQMNTDFEHLVSTVVASILADPDAFALPAYADVRYHWRASPRPGPAPATRSTTTFTYTASTSALASTSTPISATAATALVAPPLRQQSHPTVLAKNILPTPPASSSPSPPFSLNSMPPHAPPAAAPAPSSNALVDRPLPPLPPQVGGKGAAATPMSGAASEIFTIPRASGDEELWRPFAPLTSVESSMSCDPLVALPSGSRSPQDPSPHIPPQQGIPIPPQPKVPLQPGFSSSGAAGKDASPFTSTTATVGLTAPGQIEDSATILARLQAKVARFLERFPVPDDERSGSGGGAVRTRSSRRGGRDRDSDDDEDVDEDNDDDGGVRSGDIGGGAEVAAEEEGEDGDEGEDCEEGEGAEIATREVADEEDVDDEEEDEEVEEAVLADAAAEDEEVGEDEDGEDGLEADQR